jgi:hypothetical protein
MAERGLTASLRRKAVQAGSFIQLDRFHRDSFIDSGCESLKGSRQLYTGRQLSEVDSFT